MSSTDDCSTNTPSICAERRSPCPVLYRRPDYEQADELGVQISPVMGPCMGCWCMMDNAGIDAAICEPGMASPMFRPPRGVDVCVGPVGGCMGQGVYHTDCHTLNFTAGAPVAGMPDPLARLGYIWRRSNGEHH